LTNAPPAWDRFLEELRGRVQEHEFNTWLKPLSFVSHEDGELRIGAPALFYRQWVTDYYLPPILEAARACFGDPARVELVVVEEAPAAALSVPSPAPTAASQAAPSPAALPAPPDAPAPAALPAARQFGTLDARYTFDRFVVGKANEFAHAAAFSVANNPGQSYNPLFIYGGVGLGKTHLLHAIGHLVRQTNPSMKVCYVDAEKFTNEMISSMRPDRGDMTGFKSKYRGVDMLLMDDVQFIAGKERTQEEFFHTFNALYSRQKQIVVTSDKISTEIPDLEKRIQSRFEWGLVVDIGAPDLETKVAILNRKAEADKIPLPQDVAFFLASTIQTSNIRDLEGALNKLGAHSSLMKKTITVDLAKEVFASLLNAAPKEVAPEAIIKAVADHHGIKISELKSGRKHKVVVEPRQIAMYLLRQMTPLSYPDIGARFGGKDHTTVMHAVKKIGERMRDDVSFRGAIEALRKSIEG
jgi:chromosomal replication initiator protein